MQWNLLNHGDRYEQAAWPRFLARSLPEYEDFWRSYVVPMTGRRYMTPDRYDWRQGLRRLPRNQLYDEGYRDWHLAAEQLHYTTLLHLVRAEALCGQPLDRDGFIEAVVRLSAGLDTADELLGRCCPTEGISDETRRDVREGAAFEIRKRWRKSGNVPDGVHAVRKYRNDLVHGRAKPWSERLEGTDRVRLGFVPLDSLDDSGQWLETRRPAVLADAEDVARGAWKRVCDYLRVMWAEHLLQWDWQSTLGDSKPQSSAGPPIQLITSMDDDYAGGSLLDEVLGSEVGSYSVRLPPETPEQ